MPPTTPCPKRRPSWRQDNPRDELVSVIQSIRGNASNMKRGIVCNDAISRIVENSDEAQELLRMMLYGFVERWPPE